ncbi:MAG TPA: efflux RND transporter periplasmic adaptor subunit [Thermoanaerobaculia bacterium]
MKKTLVIVAILVLVGAGVVFVVKGRGSEGPKYRKEKLEKGDVVATVTATGSLSAVITVQVGSQVSGIISKLYVDFNANVKKGQLLAELDPTPFQQAVDQQSANLEKAKVQLRDAEISLKRQKRLFAELLAPQSDLDAATTARDSAAATVEQAVASLRQAQTNLSYSKIRSPIDGTVVSRQYDIGQTVAASFQAPTLFTIAQDLEKMQVLTNIDEADVGRIRLGQVASFTVDAFSDIRFKGTVAQIRLSPQIVQNVVTYPVMLDVPNPDLKLKPGMTANVLVPVDERKGTLKVANAALRFRPDPADLVKEEVKDAKAASGEAPKTPQGSAAPGGQGRPGGGSGRGPGAGPGAGRGVGGQRTASLYVDAGNGKLKPVSVKTSITDGNTTAIETTELKEGDEIVVGLATAKAGLPGGSSAGGGPPRRVGM